MSFFISRSRKRERALHRAEKARIEHALASAALVDAYHAVATGKINHEVDLLAQQTRARRTRRELDEAERELAKMVKP